MVKKLERGEEAGRPAFAVPRCGLAFTSLSRIEFSLTPRLDSTILGGEFQKMQWPRLLAYITGRVDKELLVRNEYLAAENRILRAKIKDRLQLSGGGEAYLGRNRPPAGTQGIGRSGGGRKARNPSALVS